MDTNLLGKNGLQIKVFNLGSYCTSYDVNKFLSEHDGFIVDIQYIPSRDISRPIQVIITYINESVI